MSEFESYYPPKPVIERRDPKRHISITILSIIVFALTFSLITDNYVLISIIVGALFFHELGHFIMMKIFGYKNLSMLFIPFIGAMVSGKKKIYSQIERSLMVMAGPVPGVLLGFILLNYGLENDGVITIQIGSILIFLNVMNLIPLDPLDGGQLLQTLYFKKYELFQFILSITTSVGLVVLGLIMNSWIITAFGVIMGFRIKSKHKMYLVRNNMRLKKLRYEVNYEDLSDKTYQKIKSVVETHTPILKEIKENSNIEKYNQIIARQVDKVLSPPTQKDASLLYKTIILVIWAGAIGLAIYALLQIDLNTLIHAFQNR